MRLNGFTATLVSSVCIVTLATPANAQQRQFNIAAGSLKSVLDAYARQSGRAVIYKADDVRRARSGGVQGNLTNDAALSTLLKGTAFSFRTDSSGAIAIIPGEADAGGAPANHERADAADIVVTGSRIRGAPLASPVITLTERSIRDSGQASLGEVVRSIPQSFGGGQQPGIGLNVPGERGGDVGGASSINLRGIGSDATLTLLNGRRVSYSGSRQSVDVSAIPLSAVSRVEVVADGASAIYGSDAVAGVANIILKRDYKGIETRARLGTSTDGGYFTQQYGVFGGTTWNSGGVALAYEFNRNTEITSAQRSYARDVTPGLTLFPAIKSHSALLTGHQALGDTITFSVDALYNWRDEFLVYPLDFGGDLVALHGERSGGARSYVIAPSLEWAATETWRVSLSGSIADDRARFSSKEFEGAVPYYSVAGCYCNKARSIEAGANGVLTRLPAGDIKAAIGGGYRSNATAFSAGATNPQNFTRSQNSYYGYTEVSVPIVARGMGVAGIDRLNLTGAVRYERYPGIGDVATPKFGLIYAPNDIFEMKASWGKSFRAPTLRQAFQPGSVVILPAASAGGTGYPAGATVAIRDGGNGELRPERATSWSATFVVHPTGVPDGRIELSYFNTDYRDRIVSPIDRQSQALSNPVYRDYVTLAPALSQVSTLVASAPSFFNYTGAPFNPASVVAIANASNVNAGRQGFHGLDGLASYRWQLGKADHSIDISVNATYLTSEQQLTPTLPVQALAGNVFNPPHFRARGSAGWHDSALTITGTVSYIGGLTDRRATEAKRVAAQVPFDLSARYQTKGNGLAAGLDLVLSVQNLFNDKPGPIDGIFFEAPYDTTNYSPIGRFVSLSIAKAW